MSGKKVGNFGPMAAILVVIGLVIAIWNVPGLIRFIHSVSYGPLDGHALINAICSVLGIVLAVQAKHIVRGRM